MGVHLASTQTLHRLRLEGKDCLALRQGHPERNQPFSLTVMSEGKLRNVLGVGGGDGHCWVRNQGWEMSSKLGKCILSLRFSPVKQRMQRGAVQVVAAGGGAEGLA